MTDTLAKYIKEPQTDEYLLEIRRKSRAYFDNASKNRDKWRKKNWYYHKQIAQICRYYVRPDASVLEAGCSTGDLTAELGKNAAGMDFSENAVKLARQKYPANEFLHDDIEAPRIQRTFDYVVCTDTIGSLGDIWRAFRNLRGFCHDDSRLIITHYNYLWEALLRLGEKLGCKSPQPLQHWLSRQDIINLLEISGFRIVQSGRRVLLPFYIPLVSDFVNRYIAPLPLIRNLCLVQYFVARPEPAIKAIKETDVVSVIVPTRDEAGNIAPLLARLPKMGGKTEVVFVDGDSTDGTFELLEKAAQNPPEGFAFKVIKQGGKFGKGDAMRKGFDAATGDYFIILDSDISVAPEDLPKFYLALAEGKGEFINGSRLNYPMQGEAMRYLNNIANRFFGWLFSWLLDQPIRDTLCGTKAFSRENYARIKAQRVYFGDFDPFGDFDLLFGAAHLGLEIKEMPVRYRNRAYGNIKISRFRHGWLLLQMSFFAMRKIKFF